MEASAASPVEDGPLPAQMAGGEVQQGADAGDPPQVGVGDQPQPGGEYGKQAAEIARGKIEGRLAFVDRHLAGRDYLLGETFTVADAYLFTVAGWTAVAGIRTAPWPNLEAFLQRIAARPAVRAAMQAEGLLRAA